MKNPAFQQSCYGANATSVTIRYDGVLEQRTRHYCMIINIHILLHGLLETVCQVNDFVSISYSPVNEVDRINSSSMRLQDGRFPRSVLPDLSPVSRQILLPGSMFPGRPNVSTDKHAKVLQSTSDSRYSHFRQPREYAAGNAITQQRPDKENHIRVFSNKCHVISWPGMLARSFPCFTLPGTASPRQHVLIIRPGILQHPAIPGALYDSTY